LSPTRLIFSSRQVFRWIPRCSLDDLSSHFEICTPCNDGKQIRSDTVCACHDLCKFLSVVKLCRWHFQRHRNHSFKSINTQ
jgi:hypothetical protein